jgi:hypothetical protein
MGSVKPKGAPGRVRWQQRARQRTRRRSKALRPRLHDASRSRSSVRRGGTASRSGAKGREGKVCGERGTASDGRPAVTQARSGGRFVLDRGRFRRREGFGGQNGRGGDSGFRVGGNAANPRIGSPVQYPDRIRVVLNRRGGGKPRGRHADGKWHSHPEGTAAKRERSRGGVGPGSGHSGLGRWRGDLWTTPGEEVRHRVLSRTRGSDGSDRERRARRRQGQEGRAASDEFRSPRPDRRSSKSTSRTARAGRVGRARRAAARPASRDADRVLPPRWLLHRRHSWRVGAGPHLRVCPWNPGDRANPIPVQSVPARGQAEPFTCEKPLFSSGL